MDDLAKRISQVRWGSLLWKKDMRRFFRQLPLCPRDYSLIGYRWLNMLFFDTSVPMGLRSAAYMAQISTDMVVHIHNSIGFWSLNYLDDLGSCEAKNMAWSSYFAMEKILKNIGIKEAIDKSVPPHYQTRISGKYVRYNHHDH